ncbi:MAG: energy-coupling factor transporter ATPase [Ruminococcaceae bacterium]|nr:energy-coupling factor transporter ATPase [Oscillospiraceae bacterium]
MSYIIKAQDLCFSYDEDGTGKKTVENLNLSIERGSFVAIIGHNGSGKSTIAKLMCGVLEPTGGEIYIESEGAQRTLKVSNDDDLFDIRKTVGMVFQNPDNQLVATVVEEDVAFAPENLGFPSDVIREKVDRALSDVGLFEYRLHDTHKLSGGQKQRVAIAGILAMSPECVIFDESTAMLDPKGRQDVLHIISEMRDKMGITVILITHYMNEAALADRVLVVDGGKVLLDGTPREVFAKDKLLSSCGLEVPQATELVTRLFDAGADTPKTVLFEDEAADAIAEAIIKAKNNQTHER